MARSANEHLDIGAAGAVTDGDGRLVVVEAGGASQSAAAPTTQTSVSATTTSADALAENTSASYRLIENISSSADTVTLKLGSGTVTNYQGIVLPPNSSWDGWIGNRFYTGLVRCKCPTSTATLAVIEG